MKVKQDSDKYLIIEHEALGDFEIQRLHALWLDFFRSPNKYKFTSNQEDLSGYFSFGTEKSLGAPCHDPKEFFHFYENSFCPDELYHETLHLFNMLKYLAIKSLMHISTKFNLGQSPVDSLEESAALVMRIAYYPLNFESELIAHPHQDINLVTIIPQASASGLQILETDGNWISCNPVGNQAIVLFGDMLEDLTDYVIPATTHRVVNPYAQRISFVFFANPRVSFRLSKRWTAGDFLSRRMKEIGLK
jgi:2OG-Fe(II) oxygenase superfamily